MNRIAGSRAQVSMEWIRKYNFRVVIYHSFDENFRIIVLRIEIENNYDLGRISK